ncbi:MAG TPA: type I methionyl aminopeptidase [Candidatus Paceibacterota bacterium]
MITIKTPQDITHLREGGRRLAQVIDAVAVAAKPGVAATALDVLAEKMVRDGGDTPSFLHYKARGSDHAYPASLCVSINDEVVHGLPKASSILKNGDVVSLDMGLIHQGLYLDSAVTIGIGGIDANAKKLIHVTKEALGIGISAARAGKHVGDIGYVIEQFIKPHGFGIVRELAGHGVGYGVHEDPFIPNFGKRGNGAILKPGMVIAIEPMINEGGDEIYVDDDGFTFRTKDGKRSAHFEHTVLITEEDPEILTE